MKSKKNVFPVLVSVTILASSSFFVNKLRMWSWGSVHLKIQLMDQLLINEGLKINEDRDWSTVCVSLLSLHRSRQWGLVIFSGGSSCWSRTGTFIMVGMLWLDQQAWARMQRDNMVQTGLIVMRLCKCLGSIAMPLYQLGYIDLGLIITFSFHFLI